MQRSTREGAGIGQSPGGPGTRDGGEAPRSGRGCGCNPCRSLGFLAFRGSGSDGPVVTRPRRHRRESLRPCRRRRRRRRSRHDAGQCRPPGRRRTPSRLRSPAIVGGSVVLLDGRDGHTLRTLATHPEADHRRVPLPAGRHAVPRPALGLLLPGRRLWPGHDLPGARRRAPAVRGDPERGLAGGEPRRPQTGLRRRRRSDGGRAALPERASWSATCRPARERTWRYPDTPDYATPLYQDAVDQRDRLGPRLDPAGLHAVLRGRLRLRARHRGRRRPGADGGGRHPRRRRQLQPSRLATRRAGSSACSTPASSAASTTTTPARPGRSWSTSTAAWPRRCSRPGGGSPPSTSTPAAPTCCSSTAAASTAAAGRNRQSGCVSGVTSADW